MTQVIQIKKHSYKPKKRFNPLLPENHKNCEGPILALYEFRIYQFFRFS